MSGSDWSTEIAEAVAAAHSVGIIHKDLKPSNIFMRQVPDGRWHPILADFGIGAVADRSQLEHGGSPTPSSPGRSSSRAPAGPARGCTSRPKPTRPAATVQGDVYAGRLALPDVRRRFRPAARSRLGTRLEAAKYE